MKRILNSCISILLIQVVYIENLHAQQNELIQFSEHRYVPWHGIRKIGNTSIFQGNRKKHEYFEGCYFKMVSADGKSIFIVCYYIGWVNFLCFSWVHIR